MQSSRWSGTPSSSVSGLAGTMPRGSHAEPGGQSAPVVQTPWVLAQVPASQNAPSAAVGRGRCTVRRSRRKLPQRRRPCRWWCRDRRPRAGCRRRHGADRTRRAAREIEEPDHEIVGVAVVVQVGAAARAEPREHASPADRTRGSGTSPSVAKTRYGMRGSHSGIRHGVTAWCESWTTCGRRVVDLQHVVGRVAVVVQILSLRRLVGPERDETSGRRRNPRPRAACW